MEPVQIDSLGFSVTVVSNVSPEGTIMVQEAAELVLPDGENVQSEELAVYSSSSSSPEPLIKEGLTVMVPAQPCSGPSVQLLFALSTLLPAANSALTYTIGLLALKFTVSE